MSLEQAIQEARRAINRDLIPARLGNGTGTVYDLQNPGNYYLRKLEADGNFSQPFSLPVNPLASIPPVDGMPVSIGYDQRGTQIIWGADNVSMLSANVSPLILNPLDTAVYGKTSQTNLATLYYQRHGDTTNFPFTVVVFKAPVIINGVAKFFAGAGISVSSFVPASGLHCFVSVFLRTDMTLEAFASTPTNLLNPLTVDTDIADCIAQSSADSIIICAWELRSGDTVLSSDPARNVDMRQIVNTGSSSSSGSLTVTDGSTTVTDVTEIEFVGATVADLGGGVAQATITGGGGGGTKLQLDYVETTDIASGTSISGSTWTDLLSNQTFTVDNTTSVIEIALNVAAVMGGSNQSELASRLVIDSAGTPINKKLGGGFSPTGSFSSPFGGAGSVFIDANVLSAGSHTVKLQLYYSDGSGGTIYCRCSSQSNVEFLTLQVIEHKN